MREHLMLPDKPTYELNERAQLHDALAELINGAPGLTDEDLSDFKDKLKNRLTLSAQRGANGVRLSKVTLGEKPDEKGVSQGSFLSINTHPDERISVVEIYRDAKGSTGVYSAIVDTTGHMVKGFAPGEEAAFRRMVDESIVSTEGAETTVARVMERFAREYTWREKNILHTDDQVSHN